MDADLKWLLGLAVTFCITLLGVFRRLSDKITLGDAELHSRISPDIHFWREDRYMKSLFLSDVVYKRLKAIGIALPVHEIGILETS